MDSKTPAQTAAVRRAVVNETTAAAYCGISRQLLRNSRWRGYGGPAYLKIGAAVRYRVADLDRWLESRLIRLDDPEAA
jgi:hypothetical protein